MIIDVSLGAKYLGDQQCEFTVWAPFAGNLEVRLSTKQDQYIPFVQKPHGYWSLTCDHITPGTRYLYRLDGQVERPDPASRYQPEGVHQFSEVVDLHFPWNDHEWKGIPLREYIFYELHVGTFTDEGTFDAIIPHLNELKNIGITAIELMPVAQFPGGRNWGYDGVHPFAAQNTYGGPQGLHRLVDACHQKGLAVVLDVVYNHLGPEGNYLSEFGPYFTDQYKTPWGCAINFDGPYSDEVRRFFIENALYWLREFHIDALRLDAIHAIKDFSAVPFLEDLQIAVEKLNNELSWPRYLIAESDLGDARIIKAREFGGCGLAAQWSDDFHHSLHTLLTGEHAGYYEDFGEVRHLANTFRNGYAYTGQYSKFRKRTHGSSTEHTTAEQFVVCSQNHDQIGNRLKGDRLTETLSFDRLKLAAGAVLLSPFLPLLFMGEEYGELAPFQYFVSHSDPVLITAVRKGRADEFASFQWKDNVPDPQDKETFLRSKLQHSLRLEGTHKVLLEFYRELITVRKRLSSLAQFSKNNLKITEFEELNSLVLHRWSDTDESICIFNFSTKEVCIPVSICDGAWEIIIDSSEKKWGGSSSTSTQNLKEKEELFVTLAPWSFLLLIRPKSSEER